MLLTHFPRIPRRLQLHRPLASHTSRPSLKLLHPAMATKITRVTRLGATLRIIPSAGTTCNLRAPSASTVSTSSRSSSFPFMRISPKWRRASHLTEPLLQESPAFSTSTSTPTMTVSNALLCSCGLSQRILRPASLSTVVMAPSSSASSTSLPTKRRRMTTRASLEGS